MPVAPLKGDDGVAFLVASGLVYEIIAAACSSPQTAELNAEKRAGTLKKWVRIGLAESAIFILIAIMVDRRHQGPILAGGLMAGILMWASYSYALKSGLASSEEPTEEW